MCMKKIKFLEIILIASLVISVFTFLIFSIGTFGGCYIRTEISDIENPENINIEVKPGTCTKVFTITNYEEDLILYAIRGDVITFDNGKTDVNNVLLCLDSLEASNWSKDLIQPIDNFELCPIVTLDVGETYYIQRIKNSWELFTNKGSIKGYVEYSDLIAQENKIMLNISKFFGILFIISLILLIIFKNKK